MPASEHANHYFESGKPVHRLSYCAFLDVLGFSDRIRKSQAEGTQDQLLSVFHTNLGKAIERLKKDCDDTLLFSKSFTDNVVIAHPEITDDMEAEFGFLLWSLREYQFNMACEGFSFEGDCQSAPYSSTTTRSSGPRCSSPTNLRASTR